MREKRDRDSQIAKGKHRQAKIETGWRKIVIRKMIKKRK